MGNKTAKIVIDIFKRMKSDRANWDTTWSNVSFYAAPNKDDVFTHKNKSKGEEKHERLYDGSAEHFSELLGSALHSILSNPTGQWFELTTGNREVDRIPAVKDYLQRFVRSIHQILNNTNFQSEIHEVYLDLTTFGTGVLRMDSDPDNHFHFKSRPIYEVYVRESEKGIVDTLAEEDVMPVRIAFKKYGMESFGKEAAQLAKDIDSEITILHMVMPREDQKMRGIFPLGKAWASYHIWEKGGILLKESGFDEFPFIVPRWIKTTGETYGRSPTMKALPDIRMLNSIMKATIGGAQLAIRPPMAVADDGVMGRVNMRSGGLTAIRGGTKIDDVLKPILTGSRPELGLELMRDVRDRVKQSYFIDQLKLRDGRQMTAFETSVRDEDRIRLLSPILGRQHFETLQPLIVRIVSIMKRKKLLPPGMPEELKQAQLEVFFSSQIARAQRISEAENINRWFQAVAPMIEADPTTMDLIDKEKYVKLTADIYGVPEEIFTSPDRLENIREERGKQAVKEQEMQESAAASEVVKNTANVLPLTPGQ